MIICQKILQKSKTVGFIWFAKHYLIDFSVEHKDAFGATIKKKEFCQ